MPLYLPENLPAIRILADENIFTLNKNLAGHTKNKILNIGILNLMPHKLTTELDLLRMLSNSSQHIAVEFIRTGSYLSTTTDHGHLRRFYKTTKEVSGQHFDGMIVTGAPLGHLQYEAVKYWDELKTFMDWTQQNVRSSLFICWGAHAALFARYGIPKYLLPKKISGVFEHSSPQKDHLIVKGFGEHYLLPHSRYYEIRPSDIDRHPELETLSVSDVAGINMIGNTDHKSFYITGHFEYAPNALKNEYSRDMQRGLEIEIPENYFPENNPKNQPYHSWKETASKLYTNWIDFFVKP